MTIEQIKAHPWYNGPIPTEEELSWEFQERFDAFHDKKQEGDIPDPVDQNIFTDKKHVHWGEDDGDEEQKVPSLERTCKEWVPSRKVT